MLSIAVHDTITVMTLSIENQVNRCAFLPYYQRQLASPAPSVQLLESDQENAFCKWLVAIVIIITVVSNPFQ